MRSVENIFSFFLPFKYGVVSVPYIKCLVTMHLPLVLHHYAMMQFSSLTLNIWLDHQIPPHNTKHVSRIHKITYSSAHQDAIAYEFSAWSNLLIIQKNNRQLGMHEGFRTSKCMVIGEHAVILVYLMYMFFDHKSANGIDDCCASWDISCI